MTARNKIDFVILIQKRITLCGINRAIFPNDMKKLYTYQDDELCQDGIRWEKKISSEKYPV